MSAFFWLAAPLVPFLAFPAAPAEAKETFRVGQIFLVGNTETPQYFILPLLPFRPGERISLADVKRAQARLRSVGLWNRAEVRLIDPEARAPSIDVLVNIQEREWNWLLLNAGYNLVAFRFTGQLDHLGLATIRFNEKLREWGFDFDP